MRGCGARKLEIPPELLNTCGGVAGKKAARVAGSSKYIDFGFVFVDLRVTDSP